MDAVVQRGAAAVAAMRGTIDREDTHQLETFSQLKTIRSLLQAHARCVLQHTDRYVTDMCCHSRRCPPFRLVLAV